MKDGTLHKIVWRYYQNSMIAIIKPEDEVPPIWQRWSSARILRSTTMGSGSSTWAGKTENMTMEALESCARGTMWTDYDPTPLTRQWLEENGYIKN